MLTLFSAFLILASGAVQLCAADVLLVYGAGKLHKGDNLVASHLLKAGYSVTLRSDSEVSVADTSGKNLVILSDSVSDQKLGDMFRDAKVPILCSEAYQLDNLGMTALHKGTDYGQAAQHQAVQIKDAGHTLAAGLHGTVALSSKGFPMGWGIPGPNADLIATLGGSAAADVETGSTKKYAIFSYEAGTPMPGFVAPALRIALYLSSSVWAHATPQGLKLFDAAVDHGVRASEGGCVPCQSNEHKVTFVNNSGETIWVGIWGTAPTPTGYTPPSGLPNWRLDADATKTPAWCAPHGFNGGIFPRTGCVGDDGKTWVGCDSADCGGMVCTTGHQPASFCEINFDDLYKKTWYDVSYVDAFTFPIQLSVDNYTGTPDHGSDWCWTAGCTVLPACPWDTRGDGKICYGACREWEMRHADKFPWTNIQQHLAICCKCTGNSAYPSCTCGDSCCDGGCGCTPNGDIPTTGANQRCKDPFTMTGSDQCDWNKNGTGNSLDPLTDYTAYAKAIKAVCGDAYTWQYHDSAGDMNCKNDDDTPLNFTVTFGPRS